MRAELIFVARLLRAPAILVALYLIVHALFGSMTAQAGLLTPEGSVNLGVLVMGAWALLLRLLVVFAVPSLLAYRIVAHLLRRLIKI